jgi:hypothetical protein
VRLTDTTTELLGELARILDADPQKVGPDEIALATGTAELVHPGLASHHDQSHEVTAGYKHNVIPDTAEALIDIRTLPGEEDAVLAELAELVGPDIEIVVLHRDIGSKPRSPVRWSEAMTSALGTHDPGAPVLPYPLSGGTDNKVFPRLGIKGYGFAPLKLPPELIFPPCSMALMSACRLDALVFGRRVLGTCCSSLPDPPVGMLNAIILGIVQGSHEFLPISSNAHLRLVGLLPAPAGPGCRLHRDHPARHRARRRSCNFWGGPLAHHLAGSRAAGRDTAQRSRCENGWFIILGSVPIVVVLGVIFQKYDTHHAAPSGSSPSHSSSSASCSASRTMWVRRSAGYATHRAPHAASTAGRRRLRSSRESRARVAPSPPGSFPRVRASRSGPLASFSSSPRSSEAVCFELYKTIKSPGSEVFHGGGDRVATVVSFMVGLVVIVFFMNYISASFLPFVIYRSPSAHSSHSRPPGGLQPV